ncbi:MAG TPA: hypothetical protein VE220_01200, partial [Gaiellaceae bacterium]|nr:hypothetical protein [Gaiellaceae bacterium]
MKHPELARRLDEAHRRLERDGAVELELETVGGLLEGRDGADPGVDYLVEVLDSAPRLPATVTIRITGAVRSDDRQIETAFRDLCRARADAAWRQAMTVRRNGIRQLPRAALLASGAGLAAAGVSYLAENAGHTMLMVLLYAVGGL